MAVHRPGQLGDAVATGRYRSITQGTRCQTCLLVAADGRLSCRVLGADGDAGFEVRESGPECR